MATRTALLNWNVINRDTDFSNYVATFSTPWVIEWLAVSSSSVAIWKARVPCERANWDIIYALVYNNSAQEISGDWDVYIEVSQEIIDNGELWNEDWSDIAEIKVGTMPVKNALKLAVKSWSTITDARSMIKKVGELNTYITLLDGRVGSLENTVEYLVEENSDSLKEAWLIWEKYTIWDTIFRQRTPQADDCTLDCVVWNTNDNKQIHIQRLGSGVASNKLQIKAKYVWSPTTWLTVEVRKWVQVDVADDEAYWYGGGDLVCTWTIWYASITSSYQLFEVTMDWEFWGTKWELLDIVVYMTGNIVNASNYYSIACDGSQNSEWFSFVAVNGSTRTRSRLCPFCLADWFADKMLCKTRTSSSAVKTTVTAGAWTGVSDEETYTIPQTYSTLYLIVNRSTRTYNIWKEYPQPFYNDSWSWSVLVNNVVKLSGTVPISKDSQWGNATIKLTNVTQWTVIKVRVTSPWYAVDSYPWVSYIYSNTLSARLTLSPAQSISIRPLIPSEVKAIWHQWIWISYWRKSDWTWYGEFDGEIYNSAQTWSVTLWNCLWFKTITDANGEQYKIPIYWM